MQGSVRIVSVGKSSVLPFVVGAGDVFRCAAALFSA